MKQDTIENISYQTFFFNFLRKNIFFLTSFYAKNVFTVYNVFIFFRFPTLYILKLQHSDWTENLAKDFFKINFPPMRALEFITGPVIHNTTYT